MSQITIDSASYTADVAKSPSYTPLRKKEVANLQANAPFSIVEQIATIAEKCLEIHDYTKFEFTARKDEFVFRKMDDAGKNVQETYTLSLAGGQWTCVTDAGPSPALDAKKQTDITRAVTRIIANVLGARKGTSGGASGSDGGKASARSRGHKRKHKATPSSDSDTGATPLSSPSSSSRRRRRSSYDQGAAFKEIEKQMEDFDGTCSDHDATIEAAEEAYGDRARGRTAADILAAAQAAAANSSDEESDD